MDITLSGRTLAGADLPAARCGAPPQVLRGPGSLCLCSPQASLTRRRHTSGGRVGIARCGRAHPTEGQNALICRCPGVRRCDVRTSVVPDWHTPRMAGTEFREVLVRHRWWVFGLALVLAACAFAGFTVGRGSRVATEEVSCLSAQGTIGCTLHDGWDVSVPLDVAWTDSNGTFHEGGRPRCLPPTGRGLEGPVRIAWTKVEAGGSGWRQVVWIGC
jgi:hypothetical protein